MVEHAQRWFAVGQSREVDARQAGSEAAEAALERPDAKLLIVFATDAYDLPALLAGINERSGGVPLIGSTTAGEIASSGPRDTSVVVTAIGGDGFSVATSVGREASNDLRAAGAQAAECVASVRERPYRVLLLLTDGLAGDQTEIVRGAHSVAGSGVPLVGGCSGDDLKMQATYQLCGSQTLSNAVVGAVIGSEAPLGIGVRHGWSSVGEPLLVTSSDHDRVYTLNDEPALDLYLERLDAPEADRSDPDAFTRFSQTHPLGLARRGDEEQVRFIGGADFEERSLQSIAKVPQGALAWFMEGNVESVLEATDAACRDALVPLGGTPPVGMIGFDCIARRSVLGDDGIEAEIKRIVENSGGAPVSGFYTYGEIARTKGVAGFHNQTLVVLALA